MKYFLVEQAKIKRVLQALDNIPYKYVKDIIPYLESALIEAKDEKIHTEERSCKKED